MSGAVALIVAIPPLGHDVFLLDVTPLRLAIAGVLGAGGAVLVELTHRSITLLVQLGDRRAGRCEPVQAPPEVAGSRQR